MLYQQAPGSHTGASGWHGRGSLNLQDLLTDPSVGSGRYDGAMHHMVREVCDAPFLRARTQGCPRPPFGCPKRLVDQPRRRASLQRRCKKRRWLIWEESLSRLQEKGMAYLGGAPFSPAQDGRKARLRGEEELERKAAQQREAVLLAVLLVVGEAKAHRLRLQSCDELVHECLIGQ